MKTKYLISHRWKWAGWVILTIGIACGIFVFAHNYEGNWIVTNVLSLVEDKSILSNDTQFFRVISNDILDEIAAICILIGGLLVMFSKEKVEDEFIYKLRKDSLVWAFIFNFAVLLFALVFIYGQNFVHVMVFNMFTPLLFFIVRFYFLKFKNRSDEE